MPTYIGFISYIFTDLAYQSNITSNKLHTFDTIPTIEAPQIIRNPEDHTQFGGKASVCESKLRQPHISYHTCVSRRMGEGRLLSSKYVMTFSMIQYQISM